MFAYVYKVYSSSTSLIVQGVNVKWLTWIVFFSIRIHDIECNNINTAVCIIIILSTLVIDFLWYLVVSVPFPLILDYLTTHTPGFVYYKKGYTRLAAESDKVYQLLAHGRWFSPGTPASSTTKTGHHDIAEILLKMVLNIKNQSINQSIFWFLHLFKIYFLWCSDSSTYSSHCFITFHIPVFVSYRYHIANFYDFDIWF